MYDIVSSIRSSSPAQDAKDYDRQSTNTSVHWAVQVLVPGERFSLSGPLPPFAYIFCLADAPFI